MRVVLGFVRGVRHMRHLRLPLHERDADEEQQKGEPLGARVAPVREHENAQHSGRENLQLVAHLECGRVQMRYAEVNEIVLENVDERGYEDLQVVNRVEYELLH